MIFDEFTLKSQIRAVPDFPKPGVVFRDITPLFQSPRALRMTVDSFVQRYIEADFSHIGAMDARGFLIGSAVAYALNKPLVLFRKQGKLPADVLGVIGWFQLDLLRKDGQLFNWRSWKHGLGTLFGLRKGFFTRLLLPYLDYYRPGFHPSDHDTAKLEKYWKDKLAFAD